MKKPIVVISCHNCCVKEGWENVPFFSQELRDDNVYSHECAECRFTSYYVLGALKYEILCDMALLSLKQRAFNESLLTMSASFERFLEFSVAFIQSDFGLRREEIHAYWDNVGRQSERQRGAFELAMSLYENKAARTWPKRPSLNRLAELRNRVAHSGKLASEQEAWKYCDQMFSWIKSSQIFLCGDDGRAWARTATIFNSTSYEKAVGLLGGRFGHAFSLSYETTMGAQSRPMYLQTLSEALLKAERIHDNNVARVSSLKERA